MESVGRTGRLTMYEDMPAGASPGLASTMPVNACWANARIRSMLACDADGGQKLGARRFET
jgi:hypothetical protein